VLVIAGVVVALTYVSAYRMPHHRGWSFPGEPDAGALVWREAKVNAVTRQRFESALAQSLRALPRGARLLMDCSNHVGALQQAAIPFRNVINEANWPMWDQALRSPASDADFVIAITGDPVAEAVAAHPEGLEQVASIEGDPDQGRAIIYRSRERVPH
jgi:hypothetical protein